MDRADGRRAGRRVVGAPSIVRAIVVEVRWERGPATRASLRPARSDIHVFQAKLIPPSRAMALPMALPRRPHYPVPEAPRALEEPEQRRAAQGPAPSRANPSCCNL